MKRIAKIGQTKCLCQIAWCLHSGIKKKKHFTMTSNVNICLIFQEIVQHFILMKVYSIEECCSSYAVLLINTAWVWKNETYFLKSDQTRAIKVTLLIRGP